MTDRANLKPLQIPDRAAADAHMAETALYLAELAAEDNGEAGRVAKRLLAMEESSGKSRLTGLLRTAYDYAYQLTPTAGPDYADYAEDAISVIYGLARQQDYCEDDRDYEAFPLKFHQPGAMVVILETAEARRCAQGPSGPSIPSRNLARLVRLGVDTLERIVVEDGAELADWSFSAREYAEMDFGDYNYFCGQSFVMELPDLQGWLDRMPGYIPTTSPVPVSDDAVA